MRHGKVTVDIEAGPDAQKRFRVFTYGGIERWTIDEIKAYALEGHTVVLHVKAISA